MSYEKFGKYILLEKLAAGGMAEVYLAKSAGANGVNKFVAIKRILPQFSNNQEFIEMFQEEAKVSVNLNHSNVVSIYDFGIEKGQFFIVMEFVEGRNLRQIINELKKFNRSIKIEEAVYIVKEAAAGLDHAHRCVDQHTGRPLNITHRDMSPQNIMISFEGEAKVIDFGIAKKSEENGEETKAGTLKGKFAYMSPEQAEAEEVDPRTDVFALGIILWELLANDRLFTGSNENAILRKVRECQTPPIRKINPLVPVELERIVTKALAKDKNVRYQTAATLQKDLNRFLNTQYPDFSPHDFSKTVIDCFKNAFAEGREKLITYAKIDMSEKEPVSFAPPVAEEKSNSAPDAAAKAAGNQAPPPMPTQVKLTPLEPKGLTQDQQLKIDLDGIKNAKTQQQQNAKTPPRPGSPKPMSNETNVGYNTRITQATRINSPSPENNESMADVVMKLVIIAVMGIAGYWGYSKYLTPSRKIAKKQIVEEGQMDISSSASVKVSISSQPSGARIFLDGVDTGRTTPAIVPMNANKDIKITLKKESYYPYEVTKSFNDTGILTTTLQQMPQAGFININVQNGGVKPVIYVNNQRLSELPPIKRYAVTAGTQVTVTAVNPITQLKDEVTVKVDSGGEANVDLILGRTK
ncbi:protein kinase domain-containing protein [Pseudobdellovibrio sp. HCB154]|uniref:protein kinase domain-containing protein n=1 Tax=Pseudobdellovibrio sp. HCB154 TaxID=3386277 RepID=UPI0039174490